LVSLDGYPFIRQGIALERRLQQPATFGVLAIYSVRGNALQVSGQQAALDIKMTLAFL
jgi:hypothetical protein